MFETHFSEAQSQLEEQVAPVTSLSHVGPVHVDESHGSQHAGEIPTGIHCGSWVHGPGRASGHVVVALDAAVFRSAIAVQSNVSPSTVYRLLEAGKTVPPS